MKLRSKLYRAGGTIVQIDEVLYHFNDDGTGNHVAEVERDDHAAIFLAVAEGFEPYQPDADTPDPRDTNGDGEVDNAEERADLVARFEARFGKKPRANIGLAKLREAVEAP